ncbi:hypothetical protein PIB30_069548 [Stylosanthes scabra]|uniref:Uncharacterized protein n=1 Tax=Stylosanthes scabra TaxID=79078 RepID=A0ABU6QN88_9FABA|nr:hypothetical protein [Stylosanthes scabra]
MDSAHNSKEGAWLLQSSSKITKEGAKIQGGRHGLFLLAQGRRPEAEGGHRGC